MEKIVSGSTDTAVFILISMKDKQIFYNKELDSKRCNAKASEIIVIVENIPSRDKRNYSKCKPTGSLDKHRESNHHNNGST